MLLRPSSYRGRSKMFYSILFASAALIHVFTALLVLSQLDSSSDTVCTYGSALFQDKLRLITAWSFLLFWIIGITFSTRKQDGKYSSKRVKTGICIALCAPILVHFICSFILIHPDINQVITALSFFPSMILGFRFGQKQNGQYSIKRIMDGITIVLFIPFCVYLVATLINQ